MLGKVVFKSMENIPKCAYIFTGTKVASRNLSTVLLSWWIKAVTFFVNKFKLASNFITKDLRL